MNISAPLEELIASGKSQFDCLIVGSGYGGAMAAHTLSQYNKANGDPLHIALLERGNEYQPGSFPAGLNEVVDQLHNPAAPTWKKNHDSLFDVRLSDTHWVLGGNGVGGGSLINAGVMLPPDQTTLDHPAWPDEIRTLLQSKDYLNRVSVMLGSRVKSNGKEIDNTVISTGTPTSKYHSLAALGVGTKEAVATPLSIRLSDDDIDQAAHTSKCIDCGNCFSGCNFNAKKSLDTNLLADAMGHGVKIFNGAEVIFIEKTDHGWNVYVVYSSLQLRRTQISPLKLHCTNLIIAAGSVASTELLIRSEHYAGQDLFSTELGKRFYGNGDMIASVINRRANVNMIADDADIDSERHIGPTNSGMLDFRSDPHPKAGRVVLQELAVPGVLQRAMIEGLSFTQARDALTSIKQGMKQKADSFIGLSKQQVKRIAIIAGIGGDETAGEIVAAPKYKQTRPFKPNHYQHWLLDTSLRFTDDTGKTNWSAHRKRVLDLIHELTKKNDPDAGILENPIGNPLGKKLSDVFNIQPADTGGYNGWLMTVHPLGGCAMAQDVTKGVVNPIGQVFNRSGATYSDLAVLDGSVIPAPLDINPALTITAVALHASGQLAEQWGYTLKAAESTPPVLPRNPVRIIKPALREKIKPTALELNERLLGNITIQTANGPQPFVAELRLRTEPFKINQFIEKDSVKVHLIKDPTPDIRGKLPDLSRLRLFKKYEWDKITDADSILKARQAHIENGTLNQWIEDQSNAFTAIDKELDALAVVDMPLYGSIAIMEEVPINPVIRFIHGAKAWWTYRGKRDRKQKPLNRRGLLGYLSLLAKSPGLFLHAGRERRLYYDLTTGVASNPSQITVGDATTWNNKPIIGFKSFRYRAYSNPLNQLMSIELTDFPNTADNNRSNLKVDLEYFARTQAPLFHINNESDAVTGYADLVSFATWIGRITLLHYTWLLRKPDLPKDFPTHLRPNPPIEQPVDLPSLSIPHEQALFTVADPNKKYSGTTSIRLTRFRHDNLNPSQPPVLCIHGFSLGWTMYAHETLYAGRDDHNNDLKGGMAAYLARRGHDVWVIDMRSSGFLPTAKIDWNFEEAAFIDIPKALSVITEKTGHSQVDVIAHCMGAIKLSMLLASSEDHFQEFNTDDSLHQVRQKIGRIVLSQAGPFVKFSPANELRSRILNVVKNIGNLDYQFLESSNPADARQEEALDRLLSAFPYPEEEIKIENPEEGNLFWVRGRHRMDTLYGKTFLLANIAPEVLERFHDFFGKFSLRMLEQVTWLVRRNQISNEQGGKYTLRKDQLKSNWPHQTLWIHGKHNELFDPMSPVLSRLIFDQAGMTNLTIEILDNFGHQDCIMGQNCEQPFSLIANHLQRENSKEQFNDNNEQSKSSIL